MATERRDRTSFAPLDFEKENGINEDVPMVKRKRTRSLGGGGDPLSIKTLGPKVSLIMAQKQKYTTY